jgi:hypothetical protein
MEWSRASYRWKEIWKFSISIFLCINLEKILINVSAAVNIARKFVYFINYLYNFFQYNIIIKNRIVILINLVLRLFWCNTTDYLEIQRYSLLFPLIFMLIVDITISNHTNHQILP